MSEAHAAPGSAPQTEKAKGLASVIGRLVAAINKQLSPGDVAELRRLDPHDPAAPAFFKLWAASIDPEGRYADGGPARDAAERRWAAVLQALATLHELHRPGRSLGEALVEAGLSELRFVRLLRAEGETLHHELRTVAQFLASKAVGCDLGDLARLLLITDADKAEGHRRSLARGYYRHQASNS